MSALERLETILSALRNAGCEIRYDCFGGAGGGACVLKGRRILFLDLAQGPVEQLDQAEAAARAWLGSAAARRVAA